jgi:hypothetical protein
MSVTTAIYIARRVAAMLPLTLVAAAMALVAILTAIIPTRGRREFAIELIRQMTRFAAVVLGQEPAGTRNDRCCESEEQG